MNYLRICWRNNGFLKNGEDFYGERVSVGDISILEEPFVSKAQGKGCGRHVLGILQRTDCRGRCV